MLRDPFSRFGSTRAVAIMTSIKPTKLTMVRLTTAGGDVFEGEVQGRAWVREVFLGRGRFGPGLRFLPFACPLRQAKVQHLRVAARGGEDVRGLDVPVDDPLRVGGVEGVGDLDREIE